MPGCKDPKGQLGICPSALREDVLNLVKKHFNMHPKIPIDATGKYWTQMEIRRNAVYEMYNFCTTHRLASLWAYLWTSWYKPERWVLWARSVHNNVPLAKTNMVIEAHWRVLKHSYLYRFNRPRLDYVVWIICSRVLPDQVIRFHQLQLGRQHPSWFAEFKNEWKQHAMKSVPDGAEECHHTDSCRGVCSCPSFLGSRFLLCKHLVRNAVEQARSQGSQDIRLVYANFSRQEDYPFLTWDGSKLESLQHDTGESTLQNSVLANRILVAEGDDEVEDPEIRQMCIQKVAAVKRMADHLEEKLSANNLQHVSSVVNTIGRLFTVMDDIETAERKRRRQQTWKGSKPWTMFLD